ncbi:hypothetical protein BOTBODRAFT_59977 [Botryobasidium botryosum FD-172 SS1]|uniref:ubiquitinyl hydrolase 1 n=1 Tax=Botryobasidium botryosum (strain FD-172 SS1) TaxID=930990 RepID=A0A067M6I8_BOTB1|nr:hypothetical protein BOTBODRAFT_59977 [Botryobasidium botryosum FD-172 SS1]
MPETVLSGLMGGSVGICAAESLCEGDDEWRRRELFKALGIPLIVDDLYPLDPEVPAALARPHLPLRVVNNACATIAMLNGMCNVPSVTMDTEFSHIVSFSTRDEIITSSPFLLAAHNSLSSPPSISVGGPAPQAPDDAYHFVVFTPHLDGLKRAPVRHGEYTEGGEEWLGKVRTVIENRMATSSPGSPHFNHPALCADPFLNFERYLVYALLHGLAKTGGFDSDIENAKAERLAMGCDSMDKD